MTGTVLSARIGPLLLGVAVLVFGSACDSLKEKLFSPRIQVRCQMPVGICTFRNFGDPGQLCVEVEVYRRDTGAVLRSDPVCSGMMDRDAPAVVSVRFPRGDPVELCMGRDMKDDFSAFCDVSLLGDKRQ